MAADMLLGHAAGLAVGSHPMAAGAAHHSHLLPQSLLMTQHHGAQQLLLARQDPSHLLSSHHAGLVGQPGVGLTAHDYQHGMMGQQQLQQQSAITRAEVRSCFIHRVTVTILFHIYAS